MALWFDRAVTATRLGMLLCQQKASRQHMGDEEGWFLHYWLEERKTKIAAGVKHWKVEPKLMEAFGKV